MSDEVAQQLAILAATRGTSGTILESVNADDPSLFNRAEFGWANATYADLLFRTASTFRALPAPNAMRWLDREWTPLPALIAGLTALDNDAAIVSALKRLFPTTPILNAVALASANALAHFCNASEDKSTVFDVRTGEWIAISG